jgi:hypothetical protein
MVVLDLEPQALAAETARLSAVESVAVDVLDRNVWQAMQRFAASGLLQFIHPPRLLHRSAAILAESGSDADVAADRRAAELAAEAQRTLRMAKVLASGGFPEEAPALLAKVVQTAAAARMAERAELPTSVSSASDTDVRRLVERGDLPAEVLAVLDASQPSAGVPALDKLNALVAAADQVLAATGHGVERGAEPSLQAAA